MGRRFESCRAHHRFQSVIALFNFLPGAPLIIPRRWLLRAVLHSKNCEAVYACGKSDEVTGVFRIAVAAMTLTLLMCALRAACRTSAARGKSSPSALSARMHKSLIISSEFMGV